MNPTGTSSTDSKVWEEAEVSAKKKGKKKTKLEGKELLSVSPGPLLIIQS